ncbi:MAG: 30S ribosome-binding factor RbfA [Firmicutes bacterium]|nr:30S ribosome-binding factor RbfA [Bacillota bacterium]
MNQIKVERINSLLEREISSILMLEVKDPDIRFVTITRVSTTSDLSFAKVYVTVMKDDRREETLKALKDASGFIRHELMERVDLRHIPELQFLYDESIEYGKKIESIIEEIHEEEKND